MKQVTLDQISLATFESLVNARFRLMLDGGRPVDLQLGQVNRTRNDNPKFESFSLIFAGPVDVALPQGIFRLEHEQIGAFELFLVPIAREPDGMKYEAVFNRHVAR